MTGSNFLGLLLSLCEFWRSSHVDCVKSSLKWFHNWSFCKMWAWKKFQIPVCACACTGDRFWEEFFWRTQKLRQQPFFPWFFTFTLHISHLRAHSSPRHHHFGYVISLFKMTSKASVFRSIVQRRKTCKRFQPGRIIPENVKEDVLRSTLVRDKSTFRS